MTTSSCGNDVTTPTPAALFTCVQSVCTEAGEAVQALREYKVAVSGLARNAAASGEALRNVVNGPEGAYVTLPLGSSLPTLATALAGLDASPALSAPTIEEYTATAGQTTLTLTATPVSLHRLELTLDGAFLVNPTDYSLAANVVTFVHPLLSGDEIGVRIFN